MYTELNLYPLRMQAYRNLDFKNPHHIYLTLYIQNTAILK